MDRGSTRKASRISKTNLSSYKIEEMGDLALLSLSQTSDKRADVTLKESPFTFDGSTLIGTREDNYFEVEHEGTKYLQKCSWWTYEKDSIVIEELKKLFKVNQLGYHIAKLWSSTINKIEKDVMIWIVTPFIDDEWEELPLKLSDEQLIQFQDLVIFKQLIRANHNNAKGFFVFQDQIYAKFGKISKVQVTPPDTLLNHFRDTDIQSIISGFFRGQKAISFLLKIEKHLEKFFPTYIWLYAVIKNNLLDRVS